MYQAAGGWTAGPPQGAFGPTVAKVPLAPGERVLYFKKPDLSSARVWYVIAGVVLLPVLVGLYFLHVAYAFEEKVAHYYVITTMRLFTVNARGKVLEQIGVHEITDIKHRVGQGTNYLGIGAGMRSILLRHQEQHDVASLKPLVTNLRNPAFLAQVPTPPFEA